jgi:hypothetical protein
MELEISCAASVGGGAYTCRILLVVFAAFRPVEFHSNPKCFFTTTQWFSGLIPDHRTWMDKRNSAGVECETGSKPSAHCRAAVIALTAS